MFSGVKFARGVHDRPRGNESNMETSQYQQASLSSSARSSSRSPRQKMIKHWQVLQRKSLVITAVFQCATQRKKNPEVRATWLVKIGRDEGPEFQVEGNFMILKSWQISLKIRCLVCGLQTYMVSMSLPYFWPTL